MTIHKRYAIVIYPGTVENQQLVPAGYRFVESQVCPLGNTNCSFHNANITHCVRGGSDGIHSICLCKPCVRLCVRDVEYFSDTIRQMGGEIMLTQIRAQLRDNQRRR